jgi:hypothetical protein
MRIGYVDTPEWHGGHWDFPGITPIMADMVRSEYYAARKYYNVDRAVVKTLMRTAMLAACGGNRTFVDPVFKPNE